MIKLARVCHSWREIFISNTSLWTSLDCTGVNKTRLYLERSKTSPLRIYLGEWFLGNAFLLTVPHLDRWENLFFYGSSNILLRLIQHFGSTSPFLKTLSLTVRNGEEFVLQDSVFGGNLSSLHKLHLDRVITNLAWKNMSSLRSFELSAVPADKISVTQLLDLFEGAPLLRRILLDEAFPDSSDAPPGRIVPLPNLEFLAVIAQPSHTILMNHLSIPTGASIRQAFAFRNPKAKSQIHSQLPKDLKNLKHLSNITSIDLNFDEGVYLQLGGPSGNHDILGDWIGYGCPSASAGRRVLQSLDVFPVLAVEKLTISHWEFTTSPSVTVEESSIYHTLHLMTNLRTLTLTACVNLRFISVLNPKENGSGTVICPKLEQLIVYVERKDRFFFKALLAMAEERDFRGAKLENVTITCSGSFVPESEVLKLRTHVSHIEYRLDSDMSEWDILCPSWYE